jgi:predicted lipoprotein with Yx(FWY)xxD motif
MGMTVYRRTQLLCVVVAAAAVVVLFAVLVVRSPSDSRSPSGSASHARSPSSVGVAMSPVGKILVDRRGRTLYLYLPDKHGRSTCSGGCARVWPPAIVPRRPTAATGVSAAKLGTIVRADSHARQLVFAGHPLYTFVGDRKPGQLKGEDYLGAWFVISPSGRRIQRAKTLPHSSGY